MTRRWVVLGSEHPALEARELGRYRARIVARLRAWLFVKVEGALLWPDAWVIDER